MRAPLRILLLVLLALLAVPPVHAEVVQGPRGLMAAFAVRKTRNRNRVEYGLRAGAHCTVLGQAPVVPYWRMLERGASIFEPLSRLEQRAYGIASQTVSRQPEGGRVSIRLRPFRDRGIDVELVNDASGCTARATTRIGGRTARIADVLVVQAGPLSVRYIELVGAALEGGSPVRERIRP